VAHKIIVKVNNCSTSGSTGVTINKITGNFTYKAIPSVAINPIFLPKIQFFLAVIVEKGYRIPIIPAQSGQDAMSGHYPANVTNYRPGRDNLTCKGGKFGALGKRVRVLDKIRHSNFPVLILNTSLY